MITVISAPYSRAKTAADVRRFLDEAPKQADNSPEAFKGKVIEFYYQGRPGTLRELYEVYGDSEVRIIVGKEKEIIIVRRDENGNWK